MMGLGLPDRALSVICVGAHPDDIEIGCGGTLLSLQSRPGANVASLVLTGTATRAAEARAAAEAFAPGGEIETATFTDGRLPESWGEVKSALHDFHDRHAAPDVVFVPRRADRHQDHALLGALAPTVWRDALVLSYEIPKWDRDPATPNIYVPIAPGVARRKVDLLNGCFPSQHGHDWWDDELFLSVMRIRGMESRTRYAEAFEVEKAVLVF